MSEIDADGGQERSSWSLAQSLPDSVVREAWLIRGVLGRVAKGEAEPRTPRRPASRPTVRGNVVRDSTVRACGMHAGPERISLSLVRSACPAVGRVCDVPIVGATTVWISLWFSQRRGWDSNPRSGGTRQRFSRP